MGLFKTKTTTPTMQTLNQLYAELVLDDRTVEACSTGNVKALTDLLDADATEITKVDHNNWTCLHHAAVNGKCTIVDILIKRGVELNHTDPHGNTALHLACEQGQVDAVEHLLKGGVDRNVLNNESSTALHSAVNSEHSQVVKVLIEHGARIDSTQEDSATAFHLACSQGMLELVKLMLELHLAKFPTDGIEVLYARDSLGMTPLHKAAMFDHTDVVQYLIDMGSQKDLLDSEDRSPLLLAAICPELNAFHTLLKAGAKVNVIDWNKRNILHYMIHFGTTEKLKLICQPDEMKVLLSQKESTGCTPLHVAAEKGNTDFTEALLGLGAEVDSKDDNERTPVHLAAMNGHVKILRLLTREHGASANNERDRKGQTALHLASAKGHCEIVQELLNKGALLHRDLYGLTPLHLASETGQSETIKLLLSFRYCYDKINQADKLGNTALHSAALNNQAEAMEILLTAGSAFSVNNEQKTPLDICCDNGSIECGTVVVQHKRRDELLQIESQIYGHPSLGLIQCLPEVYEILLDDCHNKNPMRNRDHIKYFEFFTFDDKNANLSLSAMNHMVEHARVELLSHPVCMQFLQMKWKAYGFWTFLLNTILYMMFLFSLTYIIVSLDPEIHFCPVNASVGVETETSVKWKQFDYSLMIFLLVFLICNYLKELLEVCQQGRDYFYDIFNFFEWSVYLTSTAFVLPFIISQSSCLFSLQWQCGAVAIFLAWFNLMLYLSRADSIGIYIVMFLQILKTLLWVAIIFSVLFVAFGLGFRTLLISKTHDSLITIVNSVMMMMGEVNFVDTYLDTYTSGEIHFPTLNYLFLIVFIIFMPLLFINLLIGLAVGDIEMIRDNAKLRRFAWQVKYHTTLEMRLPTWLLNRVTQDEVRIWPNRPYVGNYALSWLIRKAGKLLGMSKRITCKKTVRVKTIDTKEGNGSTAVEDELTITKQRLNEIETRLEKQTELLSEMKINMENQTELLRFIIEKSRR